MKIKSNIVVIDGGDVKTEAEGLVSGKAIVYGSPKQPDRSRERDFFTKDTIIRKKESFNVPVYYNHGLGPIRDEIGEATLVKTADGWEATATLDLSTESGQKVYEFVKERPHGFSTGALSHLVVREAKENNTNFLKQWVVGELSITERPAERRAMVSTVKSVEGELVYEDAFEESAVVDVVLFDADDTELWNSASGEEPMALEGAAKIELKYASGSVTYQIATFDEQTKVGREIVMYEYGGVEQMINHLQDVLGKAAKAVKNKSDEDISLEEKVTSIVKSIIPEPKEDEAPTTQFEELEQKLADAEAKNSESEKELAEAKERIAQLEILADAKKTINSYKGK